MNEIYVSTDVEVDGPIPGLYSMLSVGSAAYQFDKTRIDEVLHIVKFGAVDIEDLHLDRIQQFSEFLKLHPV